MIENNLSRVATYFVYLIPFFLATGPALPDIAVVISSIIILTVIIYQKKFEYFNNIFFKYFASFYFILILSTILSEHRLHSLESSIFYIRFLIFPVVIWYLIDSIPNFLRNFFIFFVAAYILALFAGYYHYFFSESIFGIEHKTRILLIASDNALMGNYLARTFPILVGLFIINYKPNYIYNIIFISILVLSDVLIFLSGERIALAIILMTSVIMVLFVKKFKLIRIFSIIISLVSIIFISQISPEIKERQIDKTMDQIGLNSESEQIYTFSEVHQSLYETSIKIFIDNPTFGIGPNNFRYFCNKKEYEINRHSCSTHPHNIYVQGLLEIGIVGFAFIFVLFCKIIYVFVLHLRSVLFSYERYLNDFQVCLYTAILSSLFPFLPSLNLFTGWINIIYYLPVGLVLYTFYSKKHD